MGLPTFEILFKQLASTMINRSSRGIVGLIVKDSTDITFSTAEYKTSIDIETAKFTPANVQYIKDCFLGKPSKVVVIRIAVAGVITDALTIAAGLKINWIGLAEGTTEEQQSLAAWIKAQETLKKTFKAVVYDGETTDCKHIVNFTNTNVTFTDSRATTTGDKYVASLLGVFAGLPLTQSATYYTLTNLKSVVEPTDVNTAIEGGELVLINDDSVVKIGSGVNSLSTITADDSADMRKITIVEGIDLIQEDIRSAFKDTYVGKYKNKYDNQVIFLSSINTYFKSIAGEDVLDSEYANIARIDVESQRKSWLDYGKLEAEAWDDQTVKNNTYKNIVFLTGDIKLLDAIENLKFNISMF